MKIRQKIKGITKNYEVKHHKKRKKFKNVLKDSQLSVKYGADLQQTTTQTVQILSLASLNKSKGLRKGKERRSII